MGLFFGSAALTFVLETAKDTFDIILQVGAGTGLLYLVRWFWWRVNAWCEVVAMVSSFGISMLWLILHKNGIHLSTHVELLLTIAATTTCWLAAAYLAPATDRKVLIEFYRKVHPPGPGWAEIRRDDRLADLPAIASGDNLPLALLGWLAGCTTIWSTLFTVGNFIYGRTAHGYVMLGVLIVSGGVLIRVMNRLWAKPKG